MAKSKKIKPSQRLVQVDIISDVVCPWCWLGYRLFHKATQQVKTPVELTWRPYMLDPAIPSEGVDYKSYMKSKFGDTPSNKFNIMKDMLLEKGPQCHIDFQFDKITHRPNTLNAHRLIKWAQNNENAGTEAAELLFKKFFTQGEDIGEIDTLVAIAQEIGLDGEITRELLQTDRDANAIREEILFFRNLGISGVPTFIYNGQFAVQGAQDPDKHIKAIQQAAKAGAPA